MKTFIVRATYSVDCYTTVHANNKEEAEEKAHEASLDVDDNWVETNGLRDFKYTVEEEKKNGRGSDD